MHNILNDLNQEQKQAVTHQEGPLLIIAGAGTGKTRVITRRIAWLIEEKKVRPDEILSLTFTDKAASEMRERVDVLVPYGFTDMWISTFHAFGDRILRENALILGLDLEFKVLTRPETIVFFREHLFDFDLKYFRPLGDPTKFINAMITVFSRIKDEDVSVEDYQKFVNTLEKECKKNPKDAALVEECEKQAEIANCFAKFQGLLIQEGKVDFGNQFYLALELLRSHPSILKEFQEKFKYILVDEFQDTNFAQFQLVTLLAAQSRNITCVADDDQCIYRWRGAAFSNIVNFNKEYPKAEKITLVKNYRSSQSILDSAYRLIQFNNPDRFEVKSSINKQLTSQTDDGPKPILLSFDNVSSEADKVAGIISSDVKSGKFAYQDFAILVRSNKDALPFLQSLNMKDIPWHFSGNRGLYQKQEVVLCISFLRFMSKIIDSLSLYYLASSEVYQIPIAELTRINNFSWRNNRDLFWSFTQIDKIPQLSEISADARAAIQKIVEDTNKFLELSRTLTAGQLLYRFLTGTGYIKSLVKKADAESEEKIKNIAQFFDIIKQAEGVIQRPTAIEMVNYLDLLIDAGDDPQSSSFDLNEPQVNVLTIHKAKGLEFRVVFLVGLLAGRFPTTRRKQSIELPVELIKDVLPTGDFHIQEERRLFYVGMTRAKEQLYLTFSQDYGGKTIRKPSQFIFEALGMQQEKTKTKKTSSLEAIARHAPPAKGKKKGLVKTIAADEVLTLSHYKIDDYLTCPLKYKYVHILRVPILSHHTVIYGRALHETVLRYYQRRIKNKSIDVKVLIDIFRKSLSREGFLDNKHLEQRFHTGSAAIERFFKEEENKKLPTYLEKEFSFTLGNNRIIGRWDRVDVDGEKAVIIDFKSSDIKTQEAADKRTKGSLQLSIYALAFRNIFGKLPDYVSLHFLETGLISCAVPKESSLAKTQEKIEEASCGIRKAAYPATPSTFVCSYCAYSSICPEAILK